MRDEGKVSTLFALLAVTPETHSMMFNGIAAAVPWLISSPTAAGDSPHLLCLIDMDRKELQRRRKVSILFIFALLSRYSPLDVLK
jgi:hypothetical protein